MPQKIVNASQIQPGDLYEDTFRHPCLCVQVDGTELAGISLVDGSYPRTDDLSHTPVRKLTPAEAWKWRVDGPQDAQLAPQQRWWEQKAHYMVNPARFLENLYFFALYQVEWHEEVINALGAPIKHEWHHASSRIEENDIAGSAEIRFQAFGKNKIGHVYVTAHKTRDEWLFDELTVEVEKGGGTIAIIRDGKDVTT